VDCGIVLCEGRVEEGETSLPRRAYEPKLHCALQHGGRIDGVYLCRVLHITFGKGLAATRCNSAEDGDEFTGQSEIGTATALVLPSTHGEVVYQSQTRAQFTNLG
jgi:hypothetical protein